MGQWIVAVFVAAVAVLVAVNFFRARRRGMSVAESLRPDRSEFISLQDDLLGRQHTADATSSTGGPTAVQIDDRADQLHDLIGQVPPHDSGEQPESGDDPATLPKFSDETD